MLILSSSLILAKNQTIAQSNKLYYATTSILSTLAGIGFYIFYNHYHIGELTLSTYGQEKVIGFASHTLKVFLSYERGLLNYYPIVALTLVMGWIMRKSNNIYYTYTGSRIRPYLWHMGIMVSRGRVWPSRICRYESHHHDCTGNDLQPNKHTQEAEILEDTYDNVDHYMHFRNNKNNARILDFRISISRCGCSTVLAKCNPPTKALKMKIYSATH